MRSYCILLSTFVLLSGAHCAPNRARNGSSGSNTQDTPTHVEPRDSVETDAKGRELFEGILRDEGYTVSSFDWKSAAWIGKTWEEVLGTDGVTDGRLYWVLGRPIALPCSGNVEIHGKWAAMKVTWRDQPYDQFRWELDSVPPTTRSSLERKYSFRAADGDQHQRMFVPGLLIAEANVIAPEGKLARVSRPLTIEVSVGKRSCGGE